MDTRFWGPSGWRLLHLISFTYSPEQKDSIKQFFEYLPYVLPCKYCRASLTDYYKKEPIEPSLTSRSTFTKWLYTIHNLVNQKLRIQFKDYKEPDPSFESVKKIYKERVNAGCIHTEFEGWDFLFSIAENHPLSPSARKFSPMPDTPKSAYSSEDPSIKNKWNILTPEERFAFYKKFWLSVGPSLPFLEWRNAWSHSLPRYHLIDNHIAWKKELYRIRCLLENYLHLVNKEKYENLCKRLQSYKSNCSKDNSKRSKTCRASIKLKHKQLFIPRKSKTHKSKI